MRLISLLMAAVLCLSCAGCGQAGNSSGTSSASSANQSAIAAAEAQKAERLKETEQTIRDGLAAELDAIKKNATTVSLDTLGTYQTYRIDPNELLSHALARLEYSIGEITIEDSTATAHVTMKNVDVAQALRDTLDETTNNAEVRDELGSIYHSDENDTLTNTVASMFYEHIDSSDRITTTELYLHLSRNDGAWSIDESSLREIVVAVFGQPANTE